MLPAVSARSCFGRVFVARMPSILLDASARPRFVPLTGGNRLPAKEVMGGRARPVQWRGKFHDFATEEFPRLERGQSAAVTKRKRVPAWRYKRAREVKRTRKEGVNTSRVKFSVK